MKEKIMKAINEMADMELKEYENKGEYGVLKFKSRGSAKKHHRKMRLFARVVNRIKSIEL